MQTQLSDRDGGYTTMQAHTHWFWEIVIPKAYEYFRLHIIVINYESSA